MKKIKIMVDAGHYTGYNRSPANPAYNEGDVMWKFHLLLKKYLEQYNIDVVTPRSTNIDMNVYNRGTASKGCDLLISCHTNAVGGGKVDDNTDYPLVIVSSSGKGRDIAAKIIESINTTIGTKQKGHVNTDNGVFGILRGGDSVGVPSMIIENSFHTNTKVTNWLLNSSNLDKLAQNQARVIAGHFGANVNKTSITSTTPSVNTNSNASNNNTSSATTYTVKKGDSLWSIAEKLLGAGKRLNEIVTLNGLKTDALQVGQVLKIPSNVSAVNTVYTPKVGDKVTVNGTIYGNGNGSGGSIKKSNEIMYITDLVNSNQFKYYIGLAKAKDGTRQGWAEKSSVKN